MKSNRKASEISNFDSETINRKVRSLSFDGKMSDPYFIGHSDELQLADEVLRSRYLEFQSDGDSLPMDEEDFEEFLSWLEDSYEYFQIIADDRMLNF